MCLGAHCSAAGGLHLALERGRALGCSAVQLFTRNQRQWKARPISGDEVSAFSESLEGSGIRFLASHGSYLINLASKDEVLRQRSIEAFSREMERCAALGLAYVVTHPGAHGGSGPGEGMRRLVSSLDAITAATDSLEVTILLENTAGQGTSLGARLEEFGRLFSTVRRREHLGLCLDTCHAFAAGYDLRTHEGLEALLDEIDDSVGLQHLRLIHLNDSKGGCGSRLDRHEHLGSGNLGKRAFEILMAHGTLRGVPKIIETPKSKGRSAKEMADPLDEKNLAFVRGLIDEEE